MPTTDDYYNATPEERARLLAEAADTWPHWLTGPEAAAYLRISESTLRRWVTNGRVNAYRIDARTYRFKASDLDAALTPVTDK